MRILSSKMNCQAAYRTLERDRNGISFSDVVLFDAGQGKASFHAHIEKASIRFDWSAFPQKCKAHLTIAKPRIALNELKTWPRKSAGNPWLALTVSVRDGILELPGIDQAGFSYDKCAPGQIGRLKLDWEGASLHLEGIKEGDEWKLDAEFKRLEICRLRSLLRILDSDSCLEAKEGICDGWLHVALEDGKWKRSSARIDFKGVSIFAPRCSWKGIDAVVDWDGLAGAECKGLLADFLPFLPQGRLRISLSQFGMESEFGSVDHAKGELTYNAGLGAKWEIQGVGSSPNASFPFSWNGRGYFHNQRANWVESKLHFDNECASSLVFGGREEKGGTVWNGSAKKFKAEHATWLQALTAQLFSGSELEFWKFHTGEFNGEGAVYLSNKDSEPVPKIDFALSTFQIENLSCMRGGVVFGCKSGRGSWSKEKGEFILSGGDFSLPLPHGHSLIAKGWDGQYSWDPNVLALSQFNGWFETEEGRKVQTRLKAQGTGSPFNIEADLEGFLNGRVCFQIGKQEEKWEIGILPSEIEEIKFDGAGWIDRNGAFSFSSERFKGKLDGLSKVCSGSFSGWIESMQTGMRISGGRRDFDWSLQAKVENVNATVQNCQIENAKMEIDAASEEIVCFKMEGDYVFKHGKLHFCCPLLSRKNTGDWTFDCRFDAGPNETWDLLRLCGKSSGGVLLFDEKKSHLFGSSLQVRDCVFDEFGVKQFDVGWTIPWNALLAASSCLQQKWGLPAYSRFPASGAAEVRFHFCLDGGSELSAKGIDLKWNDQPVVFDLHVFEEKGGEWKIDRLILADLIANCLLRKEKDALRIEQGGGKWKNGLAAEFEGKITSDFNCDLFLSKVKIDLNHSAGLIDPFGLPKQTLEGVLEGQGRVAYGGCLEADFDLTPTAIKAGPFLLENRGPLHSFFSWEKGILFQGIDLRVSKMESEEMAGLSCDCKVDLLQYDTASSHWVFHHSLVRLPASFLGSFENRPSFFRFLDEGQDLLFNADFDCASDFSAFNCSMKRGLVPISEEFREINDLSLNWNENECNARFQTVHKNHLLSIGLDFNLGPKIGGTLSLKEEGILLAEDESPMKIEWDYSEQKGLEVQSIDGIFGGIDASFHAEVNSESNALIGSARLDFNAVSDFVPRKIAEVFNELKMGKGYELKGRLNFDKQNPFFKGILSGKQLDLFGCQFRTLLGQVDFRPDFVHIYDLKISDSAGVMKIEDISIEEKGTDWNLSIPQISISELRPCLLQKPGREPAPLSPLVVRKLKISDFKGLLDDSKTYTAQGELQFINSYKRDYTVFDLPNDVLSRIVGLDLELLIPVMGKLNFELKDRKFRLLELKDAYSESRRSEFFLAKEEEEPYMDLDGHLKILVKMKQFVLFKFTEAFLISIDGTLSDPQYRLQKKRRFFGI